MPFPFHTEVAGFAATEVSKQIAARGGANQIVQGVQFETGLPGAEVIDRATRGDGFCAPGFHVVVDKCSGQIVCRPNKKRRKRLLTCTDKADIAFVVGTLGKGQLAQTAIASLLARCG